MRDTGRRAVLSGLLKAVKGMAVSGVLLAGCTGGVDIKPWEYTVGISSTEDMGPLEFTDAVKGRDGGFSALWRGRSVWVFGDTILEFAGEDGTAWRSSTTCSTTDLDASDGISGIADPVDSLGAPLEFLPFDETETAFNDDHRGDDCAAGDDCGARYALWPGPIVVMPDGSAIIMYMKLMARPGAFNFNTLGCGIATWSDPDQPVVRPLVGPESAQDRTMLTGADEPCLAAAALVHDGYLYAYAVLDAWMSHPCIVARVPVSKMMDRAAWRFYAGGDRWETDWNDAKTVLEGSTIMSIHFNGYLGRFVAVHNSIVSGDVQMNVADNPWGPWSTPTLLFTGLDPTVTDSWDYSGLAHPEFGEDSGKIEYVSYFRPGDWSGETRLVRVVFE